MGATYDRAADCLGSHARVEQRTRGHVRRGGYGGFCGTSSATPIVSGLIGLSLSIDPGATPQEILAALEQPTVPIGGGVAHGRIDAAATLAALSVPAVPPPPAQTRL